ncbi:hypothetical protein IYW40_21210 [Methylocystis sp. H4A]|uniref:hypothetical protein n=1 Tax=Methylocystis sp. H4A TaxID=2785788 RepID=UPI0018C30755|nr:hypothetical protein [Methylocystis sp. H4A]MBG0803985.1 hypothetical protein [Methylocystis sp. H4A]
MAQNQRIQQALEAIRTFPDKHPSLMKSHHFLFDLPIDNNVTGCEYILMGINPGETDADWTRAPRGAGEIYPTEASSSYDFRVARKIEKNRSAKNWDTRSRKVLGTSDIFYTELFFWSSPNRGKLEAQFGRLKDLKKNVLLFCKEQNEVMFKERHPKAIVVSGLRDLGLVSDLYGLSPLDDGRLDLNSGDARLLIAKTDGTRPWFFLPHLSGSFGFSGERMSMIREHMQGI